DGNFNYAGAVQAYDQVFQQAGLVVPEGDMVALAERGKQHAIKEQLVAALDDWAACAWAVGRPDLTSRLLALARQRGPDPGRRWVRDVKLWQDGPALAKLATGRQPDAGSDQKVLAEADHAGTGPGGRLSPHQYYLVSVLLSNNGIDAETWLRQGQAAYQS